MAQLLVRKMPDAVKARLARRARKHGRSTEDEVRHILANAVKDDDAGGRPFGARMRRRFGGLGLERPFEELRGHVAKPARLA